MDKEYWDLVHEAYMSGKDPDLVSEDAYDMCRDRGFYSDEISLKDVYPDRRE
ncbi:MAG: hypothetical protein JRJ39_00150 [Deltaproteobacteria bacterium]|nr:hypothetical protein [Deltaproteobacteria bacterium]